MVNLQETSTTMKLVPLMCLCLVTHSGITFADENGPVVVKEDSDVVLPCSLSSNENLESGLFDWKKDVHMEVFMYDAGLTYGNGFTGQDQQFEGRVSHFPHELKNGNASIKISKTKVSDSGTYSCIFPRLQPRQTFSIQLVVGATPKPFMKVLDESKDWSLLQCEVYGASPKPVLEWRDSSGNILPSKEAQVTERGGSFDIILQTTVTKSDHYSCVVTQEQINHQTEAETYIHISGFSAGWVIAVVLSLVVLILCVLGVMGYKKVQKQNQALDELDHCIKELLDQVQSLQEHPQPPDSGVL